jgi:hypothetical protein
MNVSPGHPPSRDSQKSDGPDSGAVETHWLLDGYNVLHAALLPGELRSQIRWWNAEGRERLIQRVCCFDPHAVDVPDHAGGQPAALGSNHALDPGITSVIPTLWVVFDGDRTPPEEQNLPAHIRIIFAPSADDYLVSRSRRAESNESIYVVSSDKRVVGRCAHAGAKIVKPTDFLARCPEPEGPGIEPA